jgi:hypothetical protein
MSVRGSNPTNDITKEEHIGPNDTGDNISAKRVANYIWNGSSWERDSGGSQTFDIRNIEEDVTYKYFGFEQRGGTNWRIMRKTLATSTFMYATGTTGYATAWTNKATETYL